MSYTNSYGQPQGLAKTITNKLREALVAEIIAINGYAEHIANSDMEDVNTVWHRIMDDEKKHYGMFLSLLRKYDPAQNKAYNEHIEAAPRVTSVMQIYSPKYSSQIILNNIREDIKGEFEASVLYEQLAGEVTNADIKRTLMAISDEEKGHSEHLTRLLLKYDSDRYNGLS